MLPVRTHRIVAEKPNDREVEAAKEPLETVCILLFISALGIGDIFSLGYKGQ